MIKAAQVQETSALTAAVNWFEQLMLGSLGTSIAVVAIAVFGGSMLQGRFSLRNGARIITGVFVLFGAHSIAGGIISSFDDQVTRSVAPLPAKIELPASTPQFDPYAGAAVPSGD